MESDPPDESTGPTAIIQRAKDAMRDTPVKLADLALPSLGALGSVALSDAHDWSCESRAARQTRQRGQNPHFNLVAPQHPNTASPLLLRPRPPLGVSRPALGLHSVVCAAAFDPIPVGCVLLPLLPAYLRHAAVGVGIAAGAAARLLQQATLEQKVPFTLRKHTVLLPVFAELLLGQFSFAQVSGCTVYVPAAPACPAPSWHPSAPICRVEAVPHNSLSPLARCWRPASTHRRHPTNPQVLQQPQYRGKTLPADHPDSALIQKIAERIIAAVEEGHGSGFQKHVEKFDWEVVVINEETVNAFVLPGGKIVVFTGVCVAQLQLLLAVWCTGTGGGGATPERCRIHSCKMCACATKPQTWHATPKPEQGQQLVVLWLSWWRQQPPLLYMCLPLLLPCYPSLLPCRSDQAVQPQ